SIEGPATMSGQTRETINKVKHSGEDSAEVEELKRRDRELRQNAAVHGTSLIYQTGPDGHIYVSGRKVSLDSSEVPNNPGLTINKALEIRRAVNSQEEPSLQDLQLLVTASKMEARARAELTRESREIRGERISIVDKYV
ncbi:MAG: hypothetical protein HZC49_05135, partial [Nitrospirae bacterium]|nr:hypothetical protein [Nitrospirota bacterium]